MLGSAALLAVTIVSVGATYTPIFRAETIEVAGAAHLRREQVLRLAGLEEGADNVVHLDAGAVEAALRSHPWIEAATVTRALPTTVRLSIRERTPVAVIGSSTVVAGDGTPLPGAESGALPEIVGAARDETVAAAAIVAALPEPTRAEVARVRPEANGTWLLELRSGTEVRFGSAEDAVRKGSTLDALLSGDGGAGIGTIDVSAPSAPVITER
jgi:cell division protein FtsQ